MLLIFKSDTYMKRYFLPLSLLLNGVLLLYIFNLSSTKPASKNVSANNKHVVIISPAIHPSLEKIERGVTTNLEKYLPGAKTTLMNANGKKTLMLAQVQEAISHNPAAIVTIGAQATQLTRETLKKRGLKIPHVFTAVSSPERLGIGYHEQELTGIEEKPDYSLTAELLHHLAPQITSLLLVYNPTEGNSLDQERTLLETALQKYGIQLTTLEVFQTNEIAGKTKNLIAAYHGVIILKDNSVVSGIDGLIKVCEQYGKLLIAHDLDSGDKGAALSFGVFEEAYGLEAGKIVAEALAQTQLHLPPVRRIADDKVKLNIAAAGRQNLTIDLTEIKLLKSIIVI